MLQRAASNAYSWWWASHIRTKQSKWLEENLQDMEEKVKSMLKIIENNGDTFAQRAEMYYRKRPELINQVEDSYRAYRALAERYDHLSKDLQSANRTIATVFPEQVQFPADDDEEEEENKPTTSTSLDGPNNMNNKTNANIPKVPGFPKKDFRSQSMLTSRKKHLNRTTTSKAAVPPSSGLTKEEAQEEIDKLQKEILALQTEKEFVQSVYERCYSKSCGIENRINEMQAKISSLQDEFGIGNVIDDNEARTLMAATALKSCQETLVKLQEKQEQSAEQAKVENQRITKIREKFTNLKGELLTEKNDQAEANDEQEIDYEKTEEHNLDSTRKKIMTELEADSETFLTMMQLADKIDELVEKIVFLETEVSSQGASVNRLRSETDGLQSQIRTLKEEKLTLMQSSEIMTNRLKELEEEIQRLKSRNQSIKDQNNNLRTHFAEASCKIDHLSMKLQTAKPDDETDNGGVIQEGIAPLEAKEGTTVDEHRKEQDSNSKASEMEAEKNDAEVGMPDKHKLAIHEKIDEKKYSSDSDSAVDTELDEMGTDEEEDPPQYKKVYVNGLEDREKLLLEDYTLVLRNYKQVKKKLGDVEKKNRNGFFELALQIRELKNALTIRDEEIHSLRKIDSLKTNEDDHHGPKSHHVGSPDSMTQTASIVDNLSSLSSPQQPTFYSHPTDYRAKTELSASGGAKKISWKEAKSETKARHGDLSRPVSAIEEKIRSDIDGLLEENLEFWLRFSTAFHQIRKFQTTVHDLKVELSKVKDRTKQEGSGKAQNLVSEARPIYNHLREIQTELALWLENNSVLKDEVQSRYASLCNIQEEISRISTGATKAEETELSDYQAAKFQGELLNMKQENNKISDELHTNLKRVGELKGEVEKILAKLDEEFGISASKPRGSTNRARIPLRSFLFGVKLKRQKHQKTPSTIFSSCSSPALQKQFSDMETAGGVAQ